VTTGKDGFKRIDTTGLEALEVESIRTLKEENDALRERVTALETGRVNASGIATFGSNGLGSFGAGLAIAGAMVFTRRRRARASM
jgi:hypothetical protein